MQLDHHRYAVSTHPEEVSLAPSLTILDPPPMSLNKRWEILAKTVCKNFWLSGIFCFVTWQHYQRCLHMYQKKVGVGTLSETTWFEQMLFFCFVFLALCSSWAMECQGRVWDGWLYRSPCLFYVGQDRALRFRCSKECDPVKVYLQGTDVTC